MKIVIEIPEKTNAHIRSDYGHGVKGLYDEDREILCDAIYHGTPYKDRPHGEWIDKGEYAECSICGGSSGTQFNGVEPIPLETNFCPKCGASMVKKEGESN